MNRPGRLAFSDPALEREWWAWFAAERGRVVRGGVAVLVGGLVAFAPVDWFLYPGVADELLALRIATTALVLVAAPAFFGRRSDERLAERGQEWLLYVCATTFLGLGLLGLVVAPVVTDERLFASILAMCVLLSGLYGATGLRFRYAATLGLGMSVAFVVVSLGRGSPPPGFTLALATYLPAANAFGLLMSWTLEDQARRAFLRARDLSREQQRSEALLLNVMPRAYAARLEATPGACVDRLPDATVLFATIVGFEDATAGSHPLEAVALLDRLVARFDALADAEGVERIKTIGAAYMAAAGVSRTRPDHAAAAARLAVRMRDVVREVAREEGVPLALRVGIASGPLVVGVIGRTRYAFDCWGDTANTAARLDTNGAPDRIQATAPVAAAVGGALRAEPRGEIHLKGKGAVAAFWIEP